MNEHTYVFTVFGSIVGALYGLYVAFKKKENPVGFISHVFIYGLSFALAGLLIDLLDPVKF